MVEVVVVVVVAVVAVEKSYRDGGDGQTHKHSSCLARLLLNS